VRRSCQTIALWIGSPVWRSHRIVVSRWLVMPIPAMSAAASLAPARAARLVAMTDCQISSGSCSTHPGRGKLCVNSCCARARGAPSASKIIARVLVVPWSMVRMYLGLLILADDIPFAVALSRG